MSKRRRGFPSETQVKCGVRVVHGDKQLEESSDAMTPAHVAAVCDSKNAVCDRAACVGSNRDEYF